MSYLLNRGVVLLLGAFVLAGCSGGGNTTNITNQVSPVAVSSVFPAEAKAGESITVHGQNFGASQGTSTLSINGTAATTITGWTDTLITAVVPTGASSGNVTVTVGGVAGAPGYLVVPWLAENPGNVAISTAAIGQTNPQLVSDGAGGAIIVWQDSRSGTNDDIYAQRVNSTGAVQWTADGVAISTAANGQMNPQIVSDGAGGAIIAWSDLRSGGYDVYAQRVNSAGAVQWTANGVAISTAVNNQLAPQVVSDGAGGAIIVWHDSRSGNYDIYAQRVNSAGAVQWTADGVAISAAAIDQTNPQLVADGAGGAIIAWDDLRSGTNDDIYAQRVNSAGAVQWTADGVAISTAVSNQITPKLVADGAGGAIIVWPDTRGGASDIYAQRVNSAGAVQWTADGVAISTAANGQANPELVADGAGGAIIVWQDVRGGTNDIYAQRVNSAGALQWTADGVAISTAALEQQLPQLVTDGAGGAIIVWHDWRGGSYDIYAQQVTSAGATLWTTDGVAISTAANDQTFPQLVADDAGGAVIVWQDFRSGSNYDVYTQGITAGGRQ